MNERRIREICRTHAKRLSYEDLKRVFDYEGRQRLHEKELRVHGVEFLAEDRLALERLQQAHLEAMKEVAREYFEQLNAEQRKAALEFAEANNTIEWLDKSQEFGLPMIADLAKSKFKQCASILDDERYATAMATLTSMRGNEGVAQKISTLRKTPDSVVGGSHLIVVGPAAKPLIDTALVLYAGRLNMQLGFFTFPQVLSGFQLANEHWQKAIRQRVLD